MMGLADVLRQGAVSEDARSLPHKLRPAFDWLKIENAAAVAGPHADLASEDLELLAREMLRRFGGEPEFTWSSYVVQTCLEAFGEACGGPPETLLRVLWQLLASRPLDQNVFNLLEAISIEARGVGLLAHPDWDLEWLLLPTSDAQECAQFWWVGLREGLVDRLPENDPVPARMDRFF